MRHRCKVAASGYVRFILYQSLTVQIHPFILSHPCPAKWTGRRPQAREQPSLSSSSLNHLTAGCPGAHPGPSPGRRVQNRGGEWLTTARYRVAGKGSLNSSCPPDPFSI